MNASASLIMPESPALSAPAQLCIDVQDLSIGYGSFVLMHGISFPVRKKDILVIMGPSGCGKSTLLRVLMGLKEPSAGKIYYGAQDFWGVSEAERQKTLRETGVLFQSGALWSSMTLAENVSLPIEHYSSLSRAEIRDLVSFKLALVGLAGFEDYYPSEISGGMRKRAGLARALALDPRIVFFDEPSAGLDPVSARLLDDLILELRDSLDMTIVVVTHELQSIFAIGTNAVYLDVDTRTMTAYGPPKQLLENSKDQKLIRFLTRGEQGMENVKI